MARERGTLDTRSTRPRSTRRSRRPPRRPSARMRRHHLPSCEPAPVHHLSGTSARPRAVALRPPGIKASHAGCAATRRAQHSRFRAPIADVPSLAHRWQQMSSESSGSSVGVRLHRLVADCRLRGSDTRC
eukprot:884102-Prymnesium_polylepis.1